MPAPGPSSVTTSSASRIGGKHSTTSMVRTVRSSATPRRIAADQAEDRADEAGDGGGREGDASETRAPQIRRDSTSRPYSSWPSGWDVDGRRKPLRDV